MKSLSLYTVAFNVPWVIHEQIRLLRKNLRDKFTLAVIDNSNQQASVDGIHRICQEQGVGYWRCNTEKHEHHEALNMAADLASTTGATHIGFLDHDIFLAEPVEIIPMIDKVGFLCIGQRHHPTDQLYAWPGWFMMSKKWLAGRPLEFEGIRGPTKKDDGDTGSRNAHLFKDEEWEALFALGLKHGYEGVRRPDAVGSQSWAVEWIAGIWLHLGNASHWLQVPAPHERDRLVRHKVQTL